MVDRGALVPLRPATVPFGQDLGSIAFWRKRGEPEFQAYRRLGRKMVDISAHPGVRKYPP
jgi:hypothetical protein